MSQVEKLLYLINKTRFETEVQLKFLAGLLKSGDYKKEFIDYTGKADLWNKTEKNGYTLNTLKYMAIQDNLLGYIIEFSIFKEHKKYDKINKIYDIVELIKYEIYVKLSENDNFERDSLAGCYAFDGTKWNVILNCEITDKIKKILDKLNIKIENIDKLLDDNMQIIKLLIFNANNKVIFDNIRDNRKELILFENGVYDLENLVFRDGLPEDFITLSCGYDYNPELNEQTVYELNQYLDSLFTKEHKLYFYNKLANILTGKEKELNIWQGDGRTGKSTLINIIKKSFGDYATFIDSSVFIELSNSDNIMDKEGKYTNKKNKFANKKGTKLIIN